jgi:hypothetical protein
MHGELDCVFRLKRTWYAFSRRAKTDSSTMMTMSFVSASLTTPLQPTRAAQPNGRREPAGSAARAAERQTLGKTNESTGSHLQPLRFSESCSLYAQSAIATLS